MIYNKKYIILKAQNINFNLFQLQDMPLKKLSFCRRITSWWSFKLQYNVLFHSNLGIIVCVLVYTQTFYILLFEMLLYDVTKKRYSLPIKEFCIFSTLYVSQQMIFSFFLILSDITYLVSSCFFFRFFSIQE